MRKKIIIAAVIAAAVFIAGCAKETSREEVSREFIEEHEESYLSPMLSGNTLIIIPKKRTVEAHYEVTYEVRLSNGKTVTIVKEEPLE